MTYKEGVGVPYARKLKKYNFNTIDDADNLPYGVPFILDGTMGTVGPTSSSFDYCYGYAKRQVLGLMMLAKGWCVVFDLNHGDIWMKQIGVSSGDNNGWKSLSFDVPLATLNSVGGIKISQPTGVWFGSGFSPEKLSSEGNISFTSEGKPYLYIQVLSSFNFKPQNPGNQDANGIRSDYFNMGPVFLMGRGSTYNDGSKYEYAWKEDYIRALAFFVSGYVFAIDFDTQEIWCTSIGEGEWHKAVGSSDYTLPVATASTLGGVKVGAGLRIENGVLTTVSQNTVNIADDLIRSRFTSIYTA
ncbi:MAG: hypothetical protein K2H85_09430 [Allobaculum sp.]|nr:hypothetical protein [Allobaculum sp.]